MLVPHGPPRLSFPARGGVWCGRCAIVGAAIAGLLGCRSGAPGASSRAGGARAPAAQVFSCTVEGLAAGVPGRIAGFCARSRGREVRAAGAFPLVEAQCAALLGPGCSDRYLGLRDVAVISYADEAGGGGRLELSVLGFDGVESSHAAYTAALIGDRDPARLAAEAFDDQGLSVIAQGRALAFRARRLIVAEYSNESETLAERAASARGRLRDVLAALAAPATGPGVPEAVKRLPRKNRLPLGVQTFVEDALGVAGLGKSAQGYYRRGERRWRALAIPCEDVDSAKDLMSTLRRHPDSHKLKYAPLGAMRFKQRRGGGLPHVRWMIGRRGRVVYGVGDEPSVLPRHLSAADEAEVKLSDHQKLLELSRIHLG